MESTKKLFNALSVENYAAASKHVQNAAAEVISKRVEEAKQKVRTELSDTYGVQ